MPCVYVLVFASVCVCVCLCTCVHLCVILSTSFSGVHADCASYWARVQTIKVLSVSLPLSFLHTHLPPFPSIFPFPYFSSLYEISAGLRQLLWTSVVPISYWIWPGEPLLFTIANGSIHASENNSSSLRKFRLHTTQTQSVINENYNGCQYLTEENPL